MRTALVADISMAIDLEQQEERRGCGEITLDGMPQFSDFASPVKSQEGQDGTGSQQQGRNMLLRLSILMMDELDLRLRLCFEREFLLRLRIHWGDNRLCGSLFCALHPRALTEVGCKLTDLGRWNLLYGRLQQLETRSLFVILLQVCTQRRSATSDAQPRYLATRSERAKSTAERKIFGANTAARQPFDKSTPVSKVSDAVVQLMQVHSEWQRRCNLAGMSGWLVSPLRPRSALAGSSSAIGRDSMLSAPLCLVNTDSWSPPRVLGTHTAARARARCSFPSSPQRLTLSPCPFELNATKSAARREDGDRRSQEQFEQADEVFGERERGQQQLGGRAIATRGRLSAEDAIEQLWNLAISALSQLGPPQQSLILRCTFRDAAHKKLEELVREENLSRRAHLLFANHVMLPQRSGVRISSMHASTPPEAVVEHADKLSNTSLSRSLSVRRFSSLSCIGRTTPDASGQSHTTLNITPLNEHHIYALGLNKSRNAGPCTTLRNAGP
jgi:hypothetical protein